jgi:hypothetical protein
LQPQKAYASSLEVATRVLKRKKGGGAKVYYYAGVNNTRHYLKGGVGQFWALFNGLLKNFGCLKK